MENKYIKIFNNETDQNDYLNTINEVLIDKCIESEYKK